jgi:glyoxylase-like metal-dependent hydrolase (beta-lactamase superfamily II)
MECQANFIAPFAKFFAGKNFPYVPITSDGNLALSLDDSRRFLASFGLQGEILHTPGHSDDSVTLVLDEGIAFTGDLHPSFMNIEDATTQRSWEKIYRHKITRIFPGHGG